MESKRRILVVEDEKSMREVLKILLEEEGYDVLSASDGLEGIALLREQTFDLVITDIKMPRADGFDVLRAAHESTPQTMVIVITAFGTTESAIEAMKLGAYAYIHKPFKIDEIRIVVKKAIERLTLDAELTYLREHIKTDAGLGNIIGKSAKMQELFKIIPKIAQGNSTVLITGESGCGKELVALALHTLSPRKEKQFVTINCATFPEGLLESELFGHMKGSFTGAVSHKEGLFEIAHGGTIFLDEIAEMPSSLQPKLLRVLENATFRRVGGVRDITVDVRVLSATNKDLREAILAGTFREDLYYRLNVIPLHIPPLRERAEDIPLLLGHFLRKFSKDTKRFSPEALKHLMHYPWKGNVRELENMIERVVLLTEHELIGPEDLPPEIVRQEQPEQTLPDIGDRGVDLEKIVEEIEIDYLRKALEKTRGVKTDAAKLLGLTFRSFRHRLQKYGIREWP